MSDKERKQAVKKLNSTPETVDGVLQGDPRAR